MGRIVREHYPVDNLPDDLRQGLALGGDVRVTVEQVEREGRTALNGRFGHFSRFRPVARSTFASPAEVDDHVSNLRAEWDRQ